MDHSTVSITAVVLVVSSIAGIAALWLLRGSTETKKPVKRRKPVPLNTYTIDFKTVLQQIELLKIPEHEPYLAALVRVCARKRKLVALFDHVLKHEVQRTKENKHTIFRGNSSASKILKYYFCFKRNQEYLRNTLADPILNMRSTGTSNLDDLAKLLCDTLDRVIASKDQLPRGIVLIMKMIKDAVHQRFPDAVVSALSGFFFLRFVCPSIITPELHNILPQDGSATTQDRKVQILAAKVIQCTANRSRLTLSQDMINVLQPVVDEKGQVVQDFIEDIAQGEGGIGEVEGGEMVGCDIQDDIALLATLKTNRNIREPWTPRTERRMTARIGLDKS